MKCLISSKGNPGNLKYISCFPFLSERISMVFGVNFFSEVGNQNIDMTTIKYRFAGLIVLVFGLVACSTPQRLPQRTMGVTAGPDKVFEQPVADLLPQLAGATATGRNGRVGYELVFWEYELANGSMANMFTCVNQPEVNCDGRLNRVCPGGGEEVTRTIASGQVRELQCRAIGIAAPGELMPTCTDNENINELVVGLMACR